MKKVLHKAGRGLVAVVHDKNVQREGKKLAVLVVVRLLLAAGASVEVAQLVQKLAG